MNRRLRASVTALVSAAVLAAGLAAPAAAAPDPAAPDAATARPPQQTAAQRTVAAMQPGWNLGNTLDAVGADETAWGNPRVTPELFDAVEDAGFRSVRIPATFGQHQGPAPDHAVDPVFLDRVEEVVDMALDEGLYVLLDVHHDSWQWVNQMPTRHDEVLAQYTALWEQLAARFRDHPRRLLLESVNEPQFAGVDDATSYALLDELNVRFHEVVRASGGRNADRVLVLPTLHTNAEQGRLDALAATFDALDDPNLAATVHYYGYWPFSVNVAGGYRYDATAQADTEGTFARVHDTFVARGVPVVLGEYGLLGFDRHTGTIEQGEKLTFFEHLGHLARTTGVTTMLWDNGQHLSRTAFTWQDPALFAQVRESWKRRSGTASSDQVFVRPGAVVDQTLTLQPHGHRVKDVRLDGRRLKPSEYRLDGDALTLPAALLQRVVGTDPAYGTRGVLEVRFSKGLPWRVEVVAADTPVLGDATGTVDDFAIPTDFRGDRLATMEARYADGTNAGPHGWTPFKEFDVTFAPEDGRIVLRRAFFAEVADGAAVHLTFHLWSGDTVAYTVTRTGTTVTGTAS